MIALFWCMVSELTIYGQLALLLLVLSEGKRGIAEENKQASKQTNKRAISEKPEAQREREIKSGKKRYCHHRYIFKDPLHPNLIPDIL